MNKAVLTLTKRQIAAALEGCPENCHVATLWCVRGHRRLKVLHLRALCAKGNPQPLVCGYRHYVEGIIVPGLWATCEEIIHLPLMYGNHFA